MKVNGTQGEYLPVSQGLQSDEDETHLTSKVGKDEVPMKNGVPESSLSLPIKNIEEAKSMEKSDKAPMSPLRKVCFVLSLLQCALFIIAFGWLIPCKLPRYLENPAKNWEYQLDNFDIVTSYRVAQLEKKSASIVFGYKSRTNSTINGFLALNALDGSKQWEASLTNEPSSLFCGKNFRTSKDGPLSCLAVDKSGRMASMRAVDGKIEWFVHSHNKTWAAKQLSLPSTGLDCSNDSINDVFVAGVEDTKNVLYIISGSTGQVINTVILTSCSKIPDRILPWMFEEQQHLVFSCFDENGFENVLSVPLDNLCETSFNESKEIPFESLDTRNLHSLEKGNSLLDILSVPVNKSANEYNQVLITKNGNIIQLVNREKESAWSFDLPSNLVLKHATSGRFLNSTSQCIAVLTQNLSNPNITTLVFIDENSGAPLLNYTFENQTATSIYTVENGPDDIDGLLVRTLSPAVKDVAAAKEELEAGVKNVTKTISDFHATFVEEKFLLLTCSGNVTFEVLLVIPMATNCGSNGCNPDLFNMNPSVTLADVDGDGSLELIQTAFVQSNKLDSVDIESNVKLSRLRTAPSSCGSCGCS